MGYSDSRLKYCVLSLAQIANKIKLYVYYIYKIFINYCNVLLNCILEITRMLLKKITTPPPVIKQSAGNYTFKSAYLYNKPIY